MYDNLQYYINSAKIHNFISKKLIENILNKNCTLEEIIFFIENTIKKKIKYNVDNPMDGGIPFPPMIGVNNVIAHQTLKDNSKKYKIKNNDIIRIDYGVHTNGYVIDSAFTYSLNNKYDDFFNISKKITRKAVSLCNVDKSIIDFGEEMDEYIHSKQFEYEGKIYNCKIIKNLNGHNIKRFHVHGGQKLPCIKNNISGKIKNNVVYALEPFISAENDYVYHSKDFSSYHVNYDKNNKYLNKNDKKLLFDIKKQYKFFYFRDNYLYNDLNLHMKQLKNLIDKKYIVKESSFVVYKNPIISHFEHNVFVNENKNYFLTKNKYY